MQATITRATSIDPTLEASGKAALAKMQYQLQVLEQKMLRAQKKKMAVALSRIRTLKTALFPNDGLQERVENFMPYYTYWGPDFFQLLKQHIEPLRHEFMIVEAG
jgi:uncharacterized protein YllA (UPF0747 family)